MISAGYGDAMGRYGDAVDRYDDATRSWLGLAGFRYADSFWKVSSSLLSPPLRFDERSLIGRTLRLLVTMGPGDLPMALVLLGDGLDPFGVTVGRWLSAGVTDMFSDLVAARLSGRLP